MHATMEHNTHNTLYLDEEKLPTLEAIMHDMDEGSECSEYDHKHLSTQVTHPSTLPSRLLVGRV